MKITLPIKENPDKILEDVKKKLATRGGSLTGNLKKGKFSVIGIKGEYIITEQQLEIVVKSKPFLIPDSFIENEINQYFKSI